MREQPVVYVIDDDPEIRESLTLTLNAAGLRAKTYSTAEEFLVCDEKLSEGPACLIVDVRLPGLSGLGLQAKLAKEGIHVPIIILSGHGNIPMAVEAMKSGALDFLQKPIHQRKLFECVQKALDQHAQQLLKDADYGEAVKRISALSEREREVMGMLVAGKALKEIAAALGIGHQTVAKHRASLFEKLEIDGVAELVRLQMLVQKRAAE